MEKLPDEMLSKILRYMDMKQLFSLSFTSKNFFYLVDKQNTYREFVSVVWTIYKNKQIYFMFIEMCQNDIENDLRLSFDAINKKGYLWRWLRRKLFQILKELNPVCVCSHLIECSRKIRTVDKCVKCTGFYVYSNTIMNLIKSATALNYIQMRDISSVFCNIKNKHIDLNVYYKASDFINHGPECVNFGAVFKDLIDKPFARFVEYSQIFVRIFLNQMKLISDFIIFNYFRDYSDRRSQRSLEKILMNTYCLHLKCLMENVNSILKTDSVNNFCECLVSGKIRYNKNQIELTNG